MPQRKTIKDLQGNELSGEVIEVLETTSRASDVKLRRRNNSTCSDTRRGSPQGRRQVGFRGKSHVQPEKRDPYFCPFLSTGTEERYAVKWKTQP